MNFSGRKVGLLPNDAFTVNLFNFSTGMVNVPMSAQQLDLVHAIILDTNEIGEDELLLNHIRLTVEVYRPYGDGNILSRRYELIHVKFILL